MSYSRQSCAGLQRCSPINRRLSFCASLGYGSHPAGCGIVEAREHQPEESIQESRERELRHRHREGQGAFRRLATSGAAEDGEFQGLGTAVTLGLPTSCRGFPRMGGCFCGLSETHFLPRGTCGRRASRLLVESFGRWGGCKHL